MDGIFVFHTEFGPNHTPLKLTLPELDPEPELLEPELLELELELLEPELELLELELELPELEPELLELEPELLELKLELLDGSPAEVGPQPYSGANPPAIRIPAIGIAATLSISPSPIHLCLVTCRHRQSVATFKRSRSRVAANYMGACSYAGMSHAADIGRISEN